MKHLGNIDLQGNYLKKGGLEPSNVWPVSPSVGMLHNFNNKVYLCIGVDADGNGQYAPVTSTVSTYLHTQTLASDQWTIHHGLNYDSPIAVVYDTNGDVIEPDTKEVIDLDTYLITFSTPVSGKAIVMCATDNLFNGGAANSGTGSGSSLPNANVLSLFQVANNALMFGTNTIQYKLENGDVIAKLGVDASGSLTYEGQAVGKQLSNADILAKFSVVNGVLYYDGVQVDNVGDTYSNSDVLSKLSVNNGILYYNGTQVDTVGTTFTNADVLSKLTVDANGNLLYNGVKIDTVGTTFSNADILSKLSVIDGVLYYNGVKVDTVGQTFTNSDVLSKLSVVNGVLYYDGVKIDTIGHVFDNQDVLDKLSVDANGKLCYNSVEIDTVGVQYANSSVLVLLTDDGNGNLLYNGNTISGSALENADVLAGFALDINGALTFNGALVGGSNQLALTVNNSGTGVNILKSVIGSDLYAKTLKAGSNITLDVTSDEVQINATLGGTVTASSTFKNTDGYTNQNTLSTSTATQISATESDTAETGLLFLARLGSDIKSTLTNLSLPYSGTVATGVEIAGLRNNVATKFTNGRLAIANGTTYTATSPATWFAGTVDWTIECDIVRDTSKLGVAPQNLVSGWNTSVAQSSAWIGLDSSNRMYFAVSNGTTSVTITSTTTITDANKHHIEVNRSGGTLRLFIDGVLAGSVAFTGSIPAGTGFWIGNSGDSVAPYYGYIRDVKVYNYAKHTAAYTVSGYFTDKVSTTNTVSMVGKYISSAFWKTVTSFAVTSTETATAYLKWLVATPAGTYGWDSTNSVFTDVDISNILTLGMTTTDLKAHFTNYNWNYKADAIGLICAFVTTDGASTPVLTSITFTAVQSADKTAGHTVESSTATMPQRTVLHFDNMTVTDNGSKTVVTGYTDSSQFTHNGASLATTVTDLVNYKGTIAGKQVDMTALNDGATIVYSQQAGEFIAAVPANGASGSGLFRTAPFAMAVGQELSVTHQSVVSGKAVYDAEEIIAGADTSTSYYAGASNVLSSSDAVILSGVSLAPRSTEFRLPFTYTGFTKGANTTLPVALATMVVMSAHNKLVVGSYTAKTLYSADLATPTTFTAMSGGLNGVYASQNPNGNVFDINDQLVMIGAYDRSTTSWSMNIQTANKDAPDTWTIGAASNYMSLWSATFTVGNYVYLVGGMGLTAAGSGGITTITNAIYRASTSNLASWTLVGTFPSYIYAASYFQYGNYLYILGGKTSTSNTVSSTAYSNKIYRASVSDPTTWTQIGTLPVAAAYFSTEVVGDRVFIGGLKTSDTPTVTAVPYVSAASNPISWSPLTTMTNSLQLRTSARVGDTVYMFGGTTTANVASNSIESYTMTYTNSASTATVLTQDLPLLTVSEIYDINVYAAIPTSTAIKTLVSFDQGVTYKYWSGTQWLSVTGMDFTNANALTLVSGNSYKVAGLTNTNVNSSYVRVAFQLSSSVSTATPRLYSATMSYRQQDMAQALLIGGYQNLYADLGVKHLQGNYSQSNVINKTGRAINMVLKVYDGYGTGS